MRDYITINGKGLDRDHVTSLGYVYIAVGEMSSRHGGVELVNLFYHW